MAAYIHNGNGNLDNQNGVKEFNVKYVSNPNSQTNPDLITTSSSSKVETQKPKTVKERFFEFGAGSSVHGVRYVTNPEIGIFRRLLWGLIICGLLSYLLFTVTNSFILYFNRPVSSVVGVTYVSNIDFPVVTLCNYNNIRRSQVDVRKLELLNSLSSPSATTINITAYEGLLAQGNFSIAYDFNRSAHDIREMLLYCTWRGVDLCDYTDFKKTLTDWGWCYAFNNPQNKTQVRKINQPGSGFGLHIRLNTQQFEYTSPDNPSAGFKVYLHSQGVRPLVKELGFSISPGYETAVSVSATQVKNLAHPYSKCRPSTESLNFSDIYTVPACLQECKETFVIDKCKCKEYRYQGNAQICDPIRMFQCIPQAEAQFIQENKNSECDCPQSCDGVVYNARLSQAYFPSELLVKQLTGALNISEEDIGKNLLDMRVFFEELSYSNNTQNAAYTDASLLSDIGGSMGLFAGMSLLSLVELVDFLIVSLWHKCCKVTRT